MLLICKQVSVRTLAYVLALLPAVFMLSVATSCRKYAVDEPDVDGTLSVALSVASAYNGPSTRMADGIVQIQAAGDAAAFRGISELHVFPFRTDQTDETPVRVYDEVLEGELSLRGGAIGGSSYIGSYSSSSNKLIENNRSRLYEMVRVPRGTDAVLVYGVAAPQGNPGGTAASIMAYRRVNGATYASMEPEAAGDITFEPVPVVASSGSITAAQTIVDALNSIVSTMPAATAYALRQNSNNGSWYSYSAGGTVSNANSFAGAVKRTEVWGPDMSYSSYATAYRSFTNYSGSSYNVMSASGASAATLITNLYRTMSATLSTGNYDIQVNGTTYRTYTSSNARGTASSIFGSVRTTVLGRIDALQSGGVLTRSGAGTGATFTFSDASVAGYPSSYGVPEGSSAIKWDEDNGRFVIAAPDNNVRLVAIEDYCYPPELWYWSNSGVRTSNTSDADIRSLYTSSNTWEQILSGYSYGTRVDSRASAIAVTSPLQYGPGLLEIRINHTSSDELSHNGSGPVAVNNTLFPVTGIIIGDQHAQAFNFTPLSDTPKYIYDTQVFTAGDSGTPKAYLSYIADNQPIRTLVYPTVMAAAGDDEEEANVHIAIEFQNNSTVSFTGAQGLVHPGSKFYLTGTLRLSDARQAGAPLADGARERIFKSDTKTSIAISITSLRAAYNTVPDMRDPQLELGIRVVMDWIEATPSTVIMY